MANDAINVQGLMLRQGTFQLGPIGFSVPRGQVLGLIGPNGAGKTTLLDLLAGIGRYDAGKISVLNQDMALDEVSIKRRLAYASRDVDYQPWKKVGQVLDFVSAFHDDWDDERCNALLASFDLARGQRIAALSFGSITKLGLVLALSRDPELLLLDEPTTGLDPLARQVLFADLMHRMRRPDRTIVIATHQLNELERFADAVAMINHGKIRFIGDMDAMAARYRRIELALSGDTDWRPLPGLTLLAQSRQRMRLMAEPDNLPPDWLAQLPGTVVEMAPFSLEEFYSALATPVSAPLTEAR